MADLSDHLPWLKEIVNTALPPWGAFEHDSNPSRCPSVFSHNHGRAQCDLRVQHEADEHHGCCAACYWDDYNEDWSLAWFDDEADAHD